MDMELDQPRLIAEVKKRLGLWSVEHQTDRDEKMALWKEIAAAMYKDWHKIPKAKAYDRVLFLQRKWRSLRDAYRRELRAQSTGVRPNKSIYRFFRIMTFLGGIGGYSFPAHLMEQEDTEEVEEEEEENNDDKEQDSSFDNDEEMIIEALEGEEEHVESFNNTSDPLVTSASSISKRAKSIKKRTSRLKSKKRKMDISSIEDMDDRQESEMPVYLRERDREVDCDSDRLFLMSFLPEMKQLPVNIKMWARAQIANIMQEAISCQYNNTVPEKEVKRQRFDSLE